MRRLTGTRQGNNHRCSGVLLSGKSGTVAFFFDPHGWFAKSKQDVRFRKYLRLTSCSYYLGLAFYEPAYNRPMTEELQNSQG
jgi:hypothetical protein